MVEFLEFFVRWFPTLIWFGLTVFGIAYGLTELTDTLRDIEAIEDDPLDHVPLSEDPRVDAAEGNFNTAWRNVVVQFIFLVLAGVVVFAKFSDPSQANEPITFIRSLVTPGLLIFGEWLLVDMIRKTRQTRKEIKHKARVILLEKERSDNELNQRDFKANERDYKANERDVEANKRDFYAKKQKERADKREKALDKREEEINE